MSEFTEEMPDQLAAVEDLVVLGVGWQGLDRIELVFAVADPVDPADQRFAFVDMCRAIQPQAPNPLVVNAIEISDAVRRAVLGTRILHPPSAMPLPLL